MKKYLLSALFVFGSFHIFSQSVLDSCFQSGTPGTSFTSTSTLADATDADLVEWTGTQWNGAWSNANVTLQPPCNNTGQRAIWMGDQTQWTSGGEGFALLLDQPLVNGQSYTFNFTYVSTGLYSNGAFAPSFSTNNIPDYMTSYATGFLPAVGYTWASNSFTFTANATQAGHTWIFVHSNTGSGMVLSFCSSLDVNLAAGADTASICAGDSIFLFAGNGFTNYYWSTGEVTPYIYANAPGLYYVTAIGGCGFSSDSVFITQTNPPVINLGNDTTLCTGASLQLNAGAGYSSYLWQNGSTNAVFNATATGVYYVTVNGNSCAGVDSVNLSFVPCSAPNVTFASSDTNFCEKQCINFFDMTTNSPVSWQWYFPGASPDTSTAQNPTGICYNNYGTYTVKLIASNSGGMDSLELTSFITEYIPPPPPVITFSNDTLYSSYFYSYQWYNDTVAIPGATGFYFYVSTPGNYYVLGTDSDGCAVPSNVIYTATEELKNEYSFVIFPNPSHGSFQVIFSEKGNENKRITITDLSGRIVEEKELVSGAKSFYMNKSLANGIYLVSLESESSKTVKKLMVY